MTTQFGKYELMDKLGEGRFGEVWRALDKSLERTVAVKILKDDWARDAGFMTQFSREAKTAGQIDHPHVVAVLEIGQEDGRNFICMKYLPGGSLEQRIERARQAGAEGLGIDEALRLARETSLGLAELHKRQVVHCDLKPANILLDAEGRAVVGDMGLARSYNVSQSTSSGRGGVQHSPGTPAYMSPEQEANAPYLRVSSDVYSLGLILYELLTLRSYKQEAPGTRLRDVRPDVPLWLDGLLAQMLEKDFEKRLWDAGKVLQAIEKGMQEQAHLKHKAEQARLSAAGAEKLRQEKEAAVAQALAAERQKQAEREHQVTRGKLSKVQEIVEQIRKTEDAEKERQHKAEAERQAELTHQKASEAEFKKREGRVELASGVVMEFVYVPAGDFMMGSNDCDDEIPMHKVNLDEYWLGKTLVTVGQFAAFVKATSYQTTAEKAGKGWGYNGKEWGEINGANWQKPRGLESGVTDKVTHPVTVVSWDDAVSFCVWASHVSGLNVRLPTEAEWEKGARSVDGRKYPWGNEQPDEKRCNFAMNVQDTTSVGMYSPMGDSPYGCVDMAGNVWEWTADWYYESYYCKSPVINPSGPDKGMGRVLRGGSFNDRADRLRSARRINCVPTIRYNYIGFRCATTRTS